MLIDMVSNAGCFNDQELIPGQLEHSEEDSGLVAHTKARTSHPALMVCKKSTAKQDEDEKKKELQLPMEKEKKEKEERARMMALEQRRRKEEEERKKCAEEEEQKCLELERRRKEEEERQQRETEEREAMELKEREEGKQKREESQKAKEELVPEDQPTSSSDVKGEEEAAPISDQRASSGDPTQGQGSRAGVTEAVSEPSEAEGRRYSSSPMCLPDGTEQKRLQWMKECVPWTKLSLQNKRKQVASAKAVRRASVKVLPPLSPDTILQSAAWSSLKQVETRNQALWTLLLLTTVQCCSWLTSLA